MSNIKISISSVRLVVVCIIFASFTSCAPNQPDYPKNESENGGFISGEPCSAPCFSGVTPGITNFDEVKTILDKNGLVLNKDDYRLYCKTNNSDDQKIIECRNGLRIDADEKTNLVNSIYLALSPRVFLDAVLEKYGQPDSIAVELTSLPDYSDSAAILFFNSIQMRITLETSIEFPYPVSASSIVVKVEIFNNDGYQQRRNDYHREKWNGYGGYKLTGY